MSIAEFFGKTVFIARLKTVSGNKKSYNTTATADGAIQGLDREARSKLGFLTERVWIAYFDIDADIKEGDRITDTSTPGTPRYRVKEVTRKDYGINQHLEVLLEEFNA